MTTFLCVHFSQFVFQPAKVLFVFINCNTFILPHSSALLRSYLKTTFVLSKAAMRDGAFTAKTEAK